MVEFIDLSCNNNHLSTNYQSKYGGKKVILIACFWRVEFPYPVSIQEMLTQTRLNKYNKIL